LSIEFPLVSEEAFGHEEIYLHQEDVSIDLPNLTILTQLIKHIAAQEGVAFRELNYIFCSDEYLLNMNRQYLDHDYYTDVITFPHLEKSLCGDIYISTDRVFENAKASQVVFDTELLRVMIHGALHLSGYGDSTPTEKKLMRAKENSYLSL
jgi:probable rRNA maturation factor